MSKPDYKKANKDLLKFLELVPDSKLSSEKNRIMDVTEDSIGIVYQFTDTDLLIMNDTAEGTKDE